MKAILEFDLDDYSDKLAHIRAVSATDAYLALSSISEQLRYMKKYMPGFTSGESIALIDGIHTISAHDMELAREVVEEIQRRVIRILEKYYIDLNNLE